MNRTLDHCYFVVPMGEPVCYRFPAMFVCGCTIPCRTAMTEVKITHVIDNLYVGPVQAAYNVEELQRLGVRHVVDLSNMDYFTRPEIFNYTKISIEDISSADISSHFDRIGDIISTAKAADQKVLVHCQAGVSRSSSVCLAYLIKYHRMSFEDALAFIKQVHPRANPNAGFVRQLRDYALCNQ